MKLLVGNIPYAMDETALQAILVPYGPVLTVRIARERDGRSKGYGFVDMPDVDALAAIEALNGSTLGGRTIHVSEAKAKTPAPLPPAPPPPDVDFS